MGRVGGAASGVQRAHHMARLIRWMDKRDRLNWNGYMEGKGEDAEKAATIGGTEGMAIPLAWQHTVHVWVEGRQRRLTNSIIL
eukprot:361367-Chlamydomonas_euryale.AAC.3